MVRRLLIFIVGVSLTMGCLLSNPPDYEEAEYRPVLISRSPSPEFIEIDKDDPLRSTTDYSVDVWYGDASQALPFRWLLEFRPDRFTKNIESSPGRDARANEENIYNASFRLNHKILTIGECYRLTVVVTDGEWDESTEENSVDVLDGANRVLANWWIVAYDSSSTSDDVLWSDCLPLAGLDP